MTFIITDEVYQQFTIDCNNQQYDYGEPYAYAELVNEEGEFVDPIKKHIRDGLAKDQVRPLVMDEAGDTVWSFYRWCAFYGILPNYYYAMNTSHETTEIPELLNTIKQMDIAKINILTRNGNDEQWANYFLACLNKCLLYFDTDLKTVIRHNYRKLIGRHKLTLKRLQFSIVKNDVVADTTKLTFEQLKLLGIKNGLSGQFFKLLSILDEYKLQSFDGVLVKVDKLVYELGYINKETICSKSAEQFMRDGADDFCKLLTHDNVR